MTELRTPRLLLRRADPEDLEPIHAMLSDVRTMRYWSTPPHDDIAQTSDWLAAMIASPPSASDDFVIVLGDRVIGKIGAYRLPDIGFILGSGHWGKGFASEAMTAFLLHVFARTDVPRLTADANPRNTGSLALLERHGFVRTGYGKNTWSTHIGLCDSVYLTLERDACLRSD